MLSTAPPNAVTNVGNESSTTSSCTIRWLNGRPGRSDITYQVCFTNVTDLDLSKHCYEPVSGLTQSADGYTRYVLENLVPYTSHLITVITANGVSDQDPENVPLRISNEAHCITAEGGEFWSDNFGGSSTCNFNQLEVGGVGCQECSNLQLI
jgi:hypothetical protein